MSTVLVLPSTDPVVNDGLGALVDALDDVQVVDAEPGPGSATARTCSAINALAPRGPLVIVAFGESALHLPSVALSQRTAHRRVTEYLLVDPVLPPVTESWPDARVTVVTDDAESPASLQGRLRGWTVLDRPDLAFWRPDPS